MCADQVTAEPGRVEARDKETRLRMQDLNVPLIDGHKGEERATQMAQPRLPLCEGPRTSKKLRIAKTIPKSGLLEENEMLLARRKEFAQDVLLAPHGLHIVRADVQPARASIPRGRHDLCLWDAISGDRIRILIIPLEQDRKGRQ